jgi:hypothetical protein
VRDEIVAETGGNPLALLELPQGMTAAQLAGGFGLPGTLGLSASIEESFRRRAKDLSSEARRLLLAAAEPYPAAGRGVIGLGELAGLDVIHGPRRASPATYDRWLQALRAADPRFAFTDPPFRHSLSVTLAFAATASRPTAVLTGPATIAGPPPGVARLPRPAGTSGMTRVSITGHPLTATAAVVWHGDLPRTLQQILFDTADGVTPSEPASPEPASPLSAAFQPEQDHAAEPTDGETPAA